MALDAAPVAEDVGDEDLAAEVRAEDDGGRVALAARGVVDRPLVRVGRRLLRPRRADRGLEVGERDGGRGNGVGLGRDISDERAVRLPDEPAPLEEAGGVGVALDPEPLDRRTRHDGLDQRAADALQPEAPRARRDSSARAPARRRARCRCQPTSLPSSLQPTRSRGGSPAAADPASACTRAASACTSASSARPRRSTSPSVPTPVPSL